jgi:hypothetical protein
MTIDEFLRMAAAQSVVNEQLIVDVWGPELKALVAERKATTLSEISTHPGQRKETRTFRRGHVLGPGLRADAIESWQRKWPSHVLPPDLTELLSHVNGIHLWADLDSQKAYFGILSATLFPSNPLSSPCPHPLGSTVRPRHTFTPFLPTIELT